MARPRASPSSARCCQELADADGEAVVGDDDDDDETADVSSHMATLPSKQAPARIAPWLGCAHASRSVGAPVANSSTARQPPPAVSSGSRIRMR